MVDTDSSSRGSAHMAVTPQGISVQTAYRWYRDGRLMVNRQYQRKLVWTVAEKQRLIDSILQDYPVPLFLFAEKTTDGPDSSYDIMDGVQRLNAIFNFIENGFLLGGRCFDVKEFARARQLAEHGVFSSVADDVTRLTPPECANILDYQLAVTIYPGDDETTQRSGAKASRGTIAVCRDGTTIGGGNTR
jgi:hypothetical protein